MGGGARGEPKGWVASGSSIGRLQCLTCVTRPLRALAAGVQSDSTGTGFMQGHWPFYMDQPHAGTDVAVVKVDLWRRNSSGALAHRLTHHWEKFL